MSEGGLELLSQEIEKYPDIKLVIIDTWKMFKLVEISRSKALYDIDYELVSQLKTSRL
jgi:hypothetical protein